LGLLFDEVEWVKSGANDITLPCPQIFFHPPIFFTKRPIAQKILQAAGAD
jgi:hypothetical protein